MKKKMLLIGRAITKKYGQNSFFGAVGQMISGDRDHLYTDISRYQVEHTRSTSRVIGMS